jgi:hypothetical protein
MVASFQDAFQSARLLPLSFLCFVLLPSDLLTEHLSAPSSPPLMPLTPCVCGAQIQQGASTSATWRTATMAGVRFVLLLLVAGHLAGTSAQVDCSEHDEDVSFAPKT